jgi:hypothetical protein
VRRRRSTDQGGERGEAITHEPQPHDRCVITIFLLLLLVNY